MFAIFSSDWYYVVLMKIQLFSCLTVVFLNVPVISLLSEGFDIQSDET